MVVNAKSCGFELVWVEVFSRGAFSFMIIQLVGVYSLSFISIKRIILDKFFCIVDVKL